MKALCAGLWRLVAALLLWGTLGGAAHGQPAAAPVATPPNVAAPVAPVAPSAPARAAAPAAKAAAPVTLQVGLPGAGGVGVAAQPATDVLKIAIGLSLLSLLPAIVVSMTAFIRIAIVLSMLRHAVGMPETPPNMVLVSLALFMTLFVMQPTLEQTYQQAWLPLQSNQIGLEEAGARAAAPLKAFMLRNVREADLALVHELAGRAPPASPEAVGLLDLVPAFMLHELRVAFQIGFVIFLPFLVIDLVVSSVLLSLGMMMVPPTMIALPVKVLMFVLIDGWALVLQGVIGGFR
jgi:flagellar biosynthetic protein FliP